MTKDEALKLALEALELEDLACRYEKDPTPEHIAKAITAIREALAQPEQEPVAWYDPEVMNEDRGISWTPGQFHTAPLYTSPQQRKPLTDEEIDFLWQNTSPYYDHQDFARAIEAAHGIKE